MKYKSSKYTVIGLITVFLGPLIIAWFLAGQGQNYIPLGKSAKGDLIVPAKPITAFELVDLEGKKIDKDIFFGKWTFVTISSLECDDACKNNLYKMRQVRLTQGKNDIRIQRLIILDNYVNMTQFNAVLNEHTGLIVGLENNKRENGLLAQLRKLDSHGKPDNRIYIIDPLGNVFMSYSKDADATFMRKDITKVIANSRIG